MRAISLVKRVEFEFAGNVVRNALTLGDVDNDGYNELIVGNQNGDVAIFKGKEKMQTISKLTFVSCVAVGDILNQNSNVLVIITADGWCYIYSSPEKSKDEQQPVDKVADEVDGQTQSTSGSGSMETLPSSESNGNKDTQSNKDKKHLVCVHMQRIPANSKSILLGDIDGDGALEMVLALTDRVVRSYRWLANPHKPNLNNIIADASSLSFEPSDKMLGKFVALNKWECANQIGCISLHHSLDGRAYLMISQPGGTFMRIRCQSDDSISQEVGVDCSQKSNSNSSVGDNIPSSIDYQSLGISRMRNQNISTEILGDLKRSPPLISSSSSSNNTDNDTNNADDGTIIITKSRPYALATLDGTIILVQDEVILWAFAIDHQVFALTKLDITGNGSDDIVVCCWDGQTYILDQDKNSVRFHLDEAVQAFDCGYYYLSPDAPNVTCLVYITFKNTIMVYYDITLKNLTCRKFEPNLEKFSELLIGNGVNREDALRQVEKFDKKTKKEIVEYLLYGVK